MNTSKYAQRIMHVSRMVLSVVEHVVGLDALRAIHTSYEMIDLAYNVSKTESVGDARKMVLESEIVGLVPHELVKALDEMVDEGEAPIVQLNDGARLLSKALLDTANSIENPSNDLLIDAMEFSAAYVDSVFAESMIEEIQAESVVLQSLWDNAESPISRPLAHHMGNSKMSAVDFSELFVKGATKIGIEMIMTMDELPSSAMKDYSVAGSAAHNFMDVENPDEVLDLFDLGKQFVLIETGDYRPLTELLVDIQLGV